MPSQFASGKYAIAECDRCGQRFKLKELRKLTIKTKQVSIKVCQECWEPDQPQLQLGMYPVNDPQAVREPRPDVSYLVSGQTGLQINLSGEGPDGFGYAELGSRVIQWGWNPVGGSRGPDAGLTPNDLAPAVVLGTVTVTTTQEFKMYKSGADGITKKGKTEGKNLGDSGSKVMGLKGGLKTAGVKNMDLKTMGRGLAKVKNQKAGRGR